MGNVVRTATQSLEDAMSDPTESPDTPSDDRATEPEDAGGHRSGLLGGRLVAVAAAVAVGLVAAVVIVSVTNGSDDETADPSEGVDISADADATEPVATDGDTDTGSNQGADEDTASWQVTTTGAFDIELRPADAALASVTVSDPATPAVGDGESQHCVLVTLAGPATVESYGCAQLAGTETVELVLSAPGDPLVGCAAVQTRDEPVDTTTIDAASDFWISEGSELPAGDYDLTVVAITGTGDGCPPAEGATEREATAETSITIG